MIQKTKRKFEMHNIDSELFTDFFRKDERVFSKKEKKSSQKAVDIHLILELLDFHFFLQYPFLSVLFEFFEFLFSPIFSFFF